MSTQIPCHDWPDCGHPHRNGEGVCTPDDAGGVQPGSERWRELVSAGIIKDGDRNWFLGDAALEIAPMGQDNARNGSQANLRQYADEIGVEYHSLMAYRQVAAAWPLNTRVSSTCWKVHQELAAHKDLIRPGMTVTQAAAALGYKNVGRTGPEADAETRAAAAAEYLRDPEVASRVLTNPDVADKVIADPAVRAAISEAQERRHAGNFGSPDTGKQERDTRHGVRFAEVEGGYAASHRPLRSVLGVVCEVDWPDEERELLADSNAKAKAKAIAMYELIAMALTGTTDVDWDAELAKLS